MKRRWALVLLFAVLAAPAARTQQPDVPLKPDAIKWSPIPFAPGAQAAWLAGGVDRPGLYALRVRLQPDAKIPPHTHPDTRLVTVLSGELYVGRGARFDAANVQVLPAGSFFVVPAQTPHYAWAKSGETIYQEQGSGPSPTILIKD